MATRKQVSCINKKDHQNAHERIKNIGGIYAGSRWKLAENVAIINIKNGLEEYFVVANGKSVDIVIETYNGREYLKTKADGYAPNNLLSLNECPA